MRRLCLACAVTLAALTASVLSRDADPLVPDVEWRYYSGDNGSKKYSPLDQINEDTVRRLRIAWRRPAVDPALLAARPNLRVGGNFRSTPIMVGGVLYASNGIGLVEAIDPESGRTIWMQKPLVEGDAGLQGSSIRGVAYWSDGAESRILTYRGQYLFALNPKTGEPFPGFGDGGKVDLAAGLGPLLRRFTWNAPPLVIRDVVVIGSGMAEQDSATRKEGPPGDVRAYDVRTGKLRWTFHVIPREGEPGIETWDEESWRYTGAGNVWAPMSGDEELGYVYLPTSSATNDMYGGHRPGRNLYSSSLVCLEAATGRRVWHFQTVHHDLFDYDNPAAPILADVTVGGRRIKAVVQITKQSFAYVFDRVTGKPVWPIEERAVPRSTVPGETSAATQPIPTKPPPFDRQGITVDDLIDFTPALRAEALDAIKPYVTGPVFTPPSVRGPGPGDTQGTIQLPGSVGGADWTGAAFDPETGMLYVPSMTNPFIADLLPGDPRNTNLRYRAADRALLRLPSGLPLTKPPYGRITAIDLNRGERAWMVANGEGPRDHPLLKPLNLPPLGQPVRAGPLVTKSLLFVSEGDQINVRTPPGGGGRKLRAFDKKTGAVVWETEFESGATGTPMTYRYRGRQYLVVAVGGQQRMPEFIALSLPAPEVRSGEIPPARRELGARLFRDERFAAPAGDFATSCASCHFFTENAQGVRAGADFLARSWIAYRSNDPRRHTLRNTPTILDVAGLRALHFDGEFASLEALVADTLTGRTMGWLAREREEAARHVRTGIDARYRDAFRQAYGIDTAALGAPQALDAAARAIADYLRTLRSRRDSPYDAFLALNGLDGSLERVRAALDGARRGGRGLKRPPSFGADALQGLDIFVTRGNCAACHPPPGFTDASFHNIGITQAEYDAAHGAGAFAALAIADQPVRPIAALREIPDRRTPAFVDLGYWNFVDVRTSPLRRAGESDARFLARMAGTFKTPTLRNLAYSSPYMHNGAYGNLPDALAEMIRLDALAERGLLRAADEELGRVRIDASDIGPLVAFLDTLNDSYRK